MTKIEKIQAEIERLIDDVGIGLTEYAMGEENGKYETLIYLRKFINSLSDD